ncbi:tautomerase family protein [Flexibacterium corallicola]|uniref:tautomerase family protein n=1 Tax=Flexibacterium corallicola TaxID=3037259 RepID=UPI00286ECC4D|nr:4-oxalocrotonate tautomerase [Pseudovibrio sp. M1P-2-3]
MPFANIRTVKGLLSEKQREELREKIFDVLLEVEGRGNPNFAKYIMVLVEEHEPSAWNVSGDNLTTDAVASLQADL